MSWSALFLLGSKVEGKSTIRAPVGPARIGRSSPPTPIPGTRDQLASPPQWCFESSRRLDDCGSDVARTVSPAALHGCHSPDDLVDGSTVGGPQLASQGLSASCRLTVIRAYFSATCDPQPSDEIVEILTPLPRHRVEVIRIGLNPEPVDPDQRLVLRCAGPGASRSGTGLVELAHELRQQSSELNLQRIDHPSLRRSRLEVGNARRELLPECTLRGALARPGAGGLPGRPVVDVGDVRLPRPGPGPDRSEPQAIPRACQHLLNSSGVQSPLQSSRPAVRQAIQPRRPQPTTRPYDPDEPTCGTTRDHFNSHGHFAFTFALSIGTWSGRA